MEDDLLGVDQEVKQRKKRVKLDEESLQSLNGLNKLLISSKKIKFKGKGHEMEDLSNLVQFYQLWAHKLYPKAQFEDFIVIVEKLGHKTTVQELRKSFFSNREDSFNYDDGLIEEVPEDIYPSTPPSMNRTEISLPVEDEPLFLDDEDAV